MDVLNRFNSMGGVLVLIGALSVVLIGALFVSVLLRAGEDGMSDGSGGAGIADNHGASLDVLAAEESEVRITVDGTPAFEGRLASGEQGSWSAESRVEVWTSNAGALEVTVNGYELGPLSEAVGHPEWSRISWSWWAGWTPH